MTETELIMYCYKVKLPSKFHEYIKTEEQAKALADLLTELREDMLPYHIWIKEEEDHLHNAEISYERLISKAEDLINFFESNGDPEAAEQQRELMYRLPQPHVQKRVTPRMTQAYRKEYITGVLKEHDFKNIKKLLPKINTFIK